MTREEVLAMVPGRELDALIGEKLFGWRRINGPKFDYDGPCENGEVLIPPEVLSEDEAFRMMPPKGPIPFYYFVNRKWSTDISAAMEVEEIFNLDREMRWEYAIQLHDVLGIGLYEPTPLDNVYQIAHATPEQRCKAALLALIESEETP